MKFESVLNLPGSDSPIGVFDSGFGGLTVLRAIRQKMPRESTIFIGDSIHFPYGPRHSREVRGYALALCRQLREMGCKLVVIACNTATAAALSDAQRDLDIPVVGVVQPGARAAVHMTKSRRVGVIATQGTISSGVYETAIHGLDAGIEVYSHSTPTLVEMAERGVSLGTGLDDESILDQVRREITYFDETDIDTLVLGCTHFPLISTLIGNAAGPGVELVSSDHECAHEVWRILERRGQLSDSEEEGASMFMTTGPDLEDFARFGQVVMDSELGNVERLDIWE